ncbi:MAG: hypothetical protein RLZZ373_2659 [Pseudomonadota bacterium]|jgi:hypothetical protein
MTPAQRSEALRLIEQIEATFGSRWLFLHETVALLRALVAQVDALAAELDLRRKSGMASDRLHNICQALEEEAASSVFSREEWDRIDAENVALGKEVETLRSDARRYRFWRKFYRSQFAINGHRSLRFMPSRPAVDVAGPDYGAVVDAAIDAAIAKETP